MTAAALVPGQAAGAPQATPQVFRTAERATGPYASIDPKDVASSAAGFDKWLRDISDGYITLERVTEFAGMLPIIGNIMALVDVLSDVVGVVETFHAGNTPEVLDLVGLGINFIGIIPVPPDLAAARMELRPMLHLVKQKLKQGAKDIGEALIQVLTGALTDAIAADLEKFIGAVAGPVLKDLLDKVGDMSDSIIGELASMLRRLIGNEPWFPKKAVAETITHNSQHESVWSHMLAAVAEAARESANFYGKAATALLSDAAKATIELIAQALDKVKAFFRSKLNMLMDKAVNGSIAAILERLVVALANRRKKKGGGEQVSAVVPGEKGTQVKKQTQAAPVESVGHQVPAHDDANDCKSCPLGQATPTQATAHSISYAMGAETLTHTDFELSAALPIIWERTYRSNLAAFDQGPFGARWLTPFSTRVDVRGQGRKKQLVHHGRDGRSHQYPWLEVGSAHRDNVEELTLRRISETLLIIDFGKLLPVEAPSPWRETYELVDTCAGKAELQGEQHFRLVSLHTVEGAAIGLRYDHVLTSGPFAGEQVLSDVVSKQGGETLAHVGVQPDLATGRVLALWEIKDGQLVRQLAAYEYNDQGDLIQAQDENAAAWHYQYDHHLVTRYTDRTGRGMNLRYDGIEPTAKAIREWADDGSYDTRLEWDKNIRLTYVTDALGKETWYYYDIDGYTYRIIYPDLLEEWFFRDAAKNIVQHFRPDGSVERFRYDINGDLVEHVRADGTSVFFEYDQQHRQVGVLDAEGGIWRRDFDVQGRLSETVDPLGRKTEFAYDKAGRPVAVTDAKGGTKKLTYTEGGHLASYTDCSGRTTRWEYDERGRQVKRIDAANHVTEYRYAPVTAAALAKALAPDAPGSHPGQLEAVVHPDGSETHFSHDAEGRLLSHTDALRRTTRYRYTGAGLIQSRVDALGQRLAYGWDALGRLTELRNENDRAHTFSYDPVGRLLEEVDFDGQRSAYRYDETTGVLAETTEGRVTTRLEFDAMGRLMSRRAAGPGQLTETETFGYYPSGRLAVARNKDAQLQWFYDAVGNVVREHVDYQGMLHPQKRTAVWLHRYDALNQRIGTTRPDGHELEWLTYGSGHVHGLMLDGQEVIGIERDELHREVVREQANGLVQTQRYDPRGRLVEQQVRRGDQREALEPGVEVYPSVWRSKEPLAGPAAVVRRYHYDAVGQLLRIGDTRRGLREYGYDPVGRLLEARSTVGHETFAFDPASTMLPGLPADERAWQQARAPAIPRVLDNLLKAYAGTSYRYDDRGNLVERLENGWRTEFEWDAFGRMARATTPQGTTSFAYDPLGRRIVKRNQPRDAESAQHVTEVVYGWEGETIAFESRREAQRTSAVHYVHQPGSFVPLLQAHREEPVRLKPTTDRRALAAATGGYDIDRDPLWSGELDEKPRPFAKEEIAFYQCDQLGTPLELTDADGVVAWEANYRAWGEAKVAVSEAARKAGLRNPIRFQGQFLDEETGLHYNRHRYYDPHAGRFVSKDPLGLLGGTNLQAYVPSPTTWIDPMGLCSRKLDKALGGVKGDGMQAHHLIPEEVWGNRKTFFTSIKMTDDDRDSAPNGLLMPGSIAKAQQLKKRYYHCGSHGVIYSKIIDRKVAAIQQEFDASGKSEQDIAHARAQIAALQGYARKMLSAPSLGSTPRRVE